jgi:hypothetical protein
MTTTTDNTNLRHRAAIAAMHALVSKSGCRSAKITAQDAIEYADALIAELNKPTKETQCPTI